MKATLGEDAVEVSSYGNDEVFIITFKEECNMQIVKQGGRVDYNYMEVFIDTLDELNSIITKFPLISFIINY